MLDVPEAMRCVLLCNMLECGVSCVVSNFHCGSFLAFLAHSTDHTHLIGTNWNTSLLITSILILATTKEINPSDMP